MKDISVAILSGGMATRLGEVTKSTPKSLLPIAGVPMLCHQINFLKKQGVCNIVLCVGHLGNVIRDYFGDTWNDINLIYSSENTALLGTGGAIKKAIPHLTKTFFVLNGDTYLPINYSLLLDYFYNQNKLGMMTLYKSDDYNINNVIFKNENIITYNKTQKKLEMTHADSGLYLFDSSVFNVYPDNLNFDLSRIFTDLLSNNQLAGYELQQKFYDMGTFQGLNELKSIFNSINQV